MADVRMRYAEYLPQASQLEYVELLRLCLVQEGRVQTIQAFTFTDDTSAEDLKLPGLHQRGLAPHSL